MSLRPYMDHPWGWRHCRMRVCLGWELTVHELSPHAPTGWGISCRWGGEQREWAGWMGLVWWRCQQHGHPKEQNFYGISVWRQKSVSRPVEQQTCNSEWALAAFFQTRETRRESRQGWAVTCLTATEPLPCHVLWRPFFQRPVTSVLPGRFKMEGDGERLEGRRWGETEGLSSHSLRRASGSEWWVHLQQAAPSVILAPASAHAF